MKKRSLGWIVLIIFISLSALVLRPVPIVREQAAQRVEGVLVQVYSDENKDVTFRLKDNPVTYYVNRGITEGLDPAQLEGQYLGQTVTLHYPMYWTPLDPFGKIRHISKVTVGSEVLFNELR